MRMSDPSGALPVLPRAREAKISELSQHFANDDLTLEELERRIERVYKAGSIAELESVTADLKGFAAVPAPPPEALPVRGRRGPVRDLLDRARILAVMSETRRTGRWSVPPRLTVVSVMSDTKLDLTQAILPTGLLEMEVRVWWASCKIIVPPGMRVINEMHAVMGAVRTKADDMSAARANPSLPTLHLSGFAVMGEVNVVVRRRERTYGDEGDD
jgi:hypothetical protein